MITSWKALTTHIESADETPSCCAIVGRATLQILPSTTDRNMPQKMDIIA